MFSNKVFNYGSSEVKSQDLKSQEDKLSETYFHCEICDKGFTTKRQFQSHKRSHEREYKCKICQKIFSTSSHLKRHRK